MEPKTGRTYIAFDATKKIASGDILEVALKVKTHLKKNPNASVVIFDDLTSNQVEIDFRGTAENVLNRLKENLEKIEIPEKTEKIGPGRPKLGVTAKEVTLMPEHWEWLGHQPGGASVTLRRLVEEAKKKNYTKDLLRQAQESTHKFMTVMAGDLPQYEEALRVLYAKDLKKFESIASMWPKDIKEHALKLAKKTLAS